MAESGSDRSSLSSVTDDESIYSGYDSLTSEESDTDCFLSLSQATEVLPYQFEPEPSPEPTAGDLHTDTVTDTEDEPSSQIGNTNW